MARQRRSGLGLSEPAMTATESLLLACLHHDPARVDAVALSRLAPGDWTAFLALAARQHVRPLVLRRLLASDVRDRVPQEVLDDLRAACRRIARRNLLFHAELARLVAALDADGIAVILLKGAHVATMVYGDVGLREIGDLDLLVHREHLDRAVAVAGNLGYAPPRPASIEVDTSVSKHATVLIKPPIFAVELHWNISDPGRLHTIDPSGLWGRTVPADVVDVPARGLSPEDLLLHLCLHTAYEHTFEFGLRSICDIAALSWSRTCGLRWDTIRDRARAWKWIPGVRLTLHLARELLGAAIPDDALGPGAFDEISEEVASAARLQVMRHDPQKMPVWRVSALQALPGLWPKMRHVGRMIALTKEDLRRDYPRVPTAWWGWWLVYPMRCRDMIGRHTRTAFGVWVLRKSTLRLTVDRQVRLRRYLFGSPSDQTRERA